jgi:hypothetical protein
MPQLQPRVWRSRASRFVHWPSPSFSPGLLRCMNSYPAAAHDVAKGRGTAPNANLNAGYGRHRDIVRALLKGRKVHRAKFGCFALFAKLGFGWRLRDVSTTRPQESESLRARRNLETHELPFFATALSARPQLSPSKVPTSISTFALEDIFSTSTLAKAVDNSNRGRLALIGTVNSALA